MRGSIAKKGNNYYVCLWIGGKKKWLSGAGKYKRKAERILNEKLAELQTGTYKDIEKVRFKKFSADWLNSYAKTKVKPSTLRSYEDILKNHLIPDFGDYYLEAITTMMLQRHIAKRLAIANPKRVKPKTVINEIVLFNEMFKHAVKWGFLKVSPAAGIERPTVEDEEMEILRPDEVNKFLDNVTPKYRTFFLTAILTGMRRGELFGLRWGDIDWNNKQIHVRKSMWRGQLISPKSKRSKRKIDMSPTLTRELKKHKLAAPLSALELVFCNPEGKTLNPDSLVKRQYHPALRRAKIHQIRFHDLRHTNVALRIEQGQNIKYIQNQLGHASIQTTLDRYGHLINEVNTEQAEKLDTILGFNGSERPGRKTVEEPIKKGLRKTATP